jgi:hypothetical protein
VDSALHRKTQRVTVCNMRASAISENGPNQVPQFKKEMPDVYALRGSGPLTTGAAAASDWQKIMA